MGVDQGMDAGAVGRPYMEQGDEGGRVGLLRSAVGQGCGARMWDRLRGCTVDQGCGSGLWDTMEWTSRGGCRTACAVQ